MTDHEVMAVEPFEPVDFQKVMSDIAELMEQLRPEADVAHDIEGGLLSLLHSQLGTAASTAFLLLAYRRETRVTPEVVTRRLVVTDSLTADPVDVTG